MGFSSPRISEDIEIHIHYIWLMYFIDKLTYYSGEFVCILNTVTPPTQRTKGRCIFTHLLIYTLAFRLQIHKHTWWDFVFTFRITEPQGIIRIRMWCLFCIWSKKWGFTKLNLFLGSGRAQPQSQVEKPALCFQAGPLAVLCQDDEMMILHMKRRAECSVNVPGLRPDRLKSLVAQSLPASSGKESPLTPDQVHGWHPALQKTASPRGQHPRAHSTGDCIPSKAFGVLWTLL